MKKIVAALCLAFLCVGIAHAQQQQRQTDTFKTKSGKDVTFTCIKHATFQIEYDGRYFYVDPVTMLKPQTDYTTMPRANYIFITHEHPDHFDRMALTHLVSTNTIVFTNPNVSQQFRNARVLQNGDSVTIADDVTLKAVPAYNYSEGRTQYHPKGRDNGYILTLDGLRIYIAGDTEDIPELSGIKDIDVAFLPCNQPYTMTPEQLVRAAKTIKPKVLFPYHYGETNVNGIPAQLPGIDVRIRHYE